MKRFIQHSPHHPGAILHEFYFERLGISISEGAKKLFITRANLSAIVNSRAGLSTLMAVKLSKAFKTTPQYWINLQSSYDLWQTIQKEKKVINEVEYLVW